MSGSIAQKGVELKPEVEIVSAMVPIEASMKEICAAIDFSHLGDQQIKWLLGRQVITFPIFVRNLIAIRQNGIEKILIHYRKDQKDVKNYLQNHPIIGQNLFWYETNESQKTNPEFAKAFARLGGFLIDPFFLSNGIFLQEFFRAIQEENPQFNETQSVYEIESKAKVYWFSKSYLMNQELRSGKSFLLDIQKDKKEILAQKNQGAYGVEVKEERDFKRAEKLLFEDVTRKKGGFLAKVLNEPISLWLAKQCAKTSIQPNSITLLNTLLGLLSAWWVFRGAYLDSYVLLALGAILFYLVDIFDGIDGELARLTLRLSKHGALYDTISDNVTLVAFLAACSYAAYVQTQSVWAFYLGGIGLVSVVFAIFYLYFFTMRYFKNASLRLYDTRFIAKLPKKDSISRFIRALKHVYTKDVFTAFMSLTLLLNQPILVMVTIPVFTILMIAGFFYLRLRYHHLLPPV